MSKLLIIKANPKEDELSQSFRLTNTFIEAYRNENPEDEVEILDLYKENIKPITKETLEAIQKGEENEARRHAEYFASFDKYVFAAPMWNLSFPAILKCYIDYIAYVGITFNYTEQGPVGLLADQPRKALHIVSRGGMYSEGPAKALDFGDTYLKGILGFMGISNVETLSLELTSVLQGEALEEAKRIAKEKAILLAKSF